MKEGREASRVRRDLFICRSCRTRATVPELNFVYISRVRDAVGEIVFQHVS